MESLAGLEGVADSFAARVAKGEDWRHDAFLARTQLAASGDTESQYKTAKAYEEGKVVARDMRAAAHWYGMAAEGGHPWAQIELAKCYDAGNGVERNPKKGEYWRHRASCQGVR
jgi:uncharacterized protein